MALPAAMVLPAAIALPATAENPAGGRPAREIPQH
jgi:hypothetical protein